MYLPVSRLRFRWILGFLFVMGSLITPAAATAQADDVQINVSNFTCTGFDWSVTAPFEVTVYVTSHDILGAGLFPLEPVTGMNPSGSRSYVIQNENQTNFNIQIAVHEAGSTEQLKSQSFPKDCPIAVEPSETPTATVVVTPVETPVETPTATTVVTPDVDESTQVQLSFTMPGGASIEGAPFSLFAPTAAQFASEPYVQGAVGPNNTVFLFDLIPGSYRLLIEPSGSPAIDLVFTIGSAELIQLAYIVDANGNATLQTQPAPPPPTSAPAQEPSSGDAAPVTSLPDTGTGSQSDFMTAMILMSAVMVVGAGSLAVIRRIEGQ